MRRDLPDRDAYFRRWSELHLGYDPRGAFLPRAWLTLTYHCARPPARLGIAPHVVTVVGALVAGAVPLCAWLGGRWLLAGLVLVVISGLLDSVDGAVAVLADRVTAAGYVLDSMVDRIADGCYLLALWLVGAPAWLCVLGGIVTMLQEYLRARAGNAGMGELAVVTVAERPTRVIVTAVALCGALVVLDHAAGAAALGAAVWFGLGAIGLGQVALAPAQMGHDR